MNKQLNIVFTSNNKRYLVLINNIIEMFYLSNYVKMIDAQTCMLNE